MQQNVCYFTRTQDEDDLFVVLNEHFIHIGKSYCLFSMTFDSKKKPNKAQEKKKSRRIKGTKKRKKRSSLMESLRLVPVPQLPLYMQLFRSFVCLFKKNCTQFSSLKNLIDEMLQFIVQEKLAVSTYYIHLFQVATFRTNCPNCHVPCDTNMKLVGILLNLFNCY